MKKRKHKKARAVARAHYRSGTSMPAGKNVHQRHRNLRKPRCNFLLVLVQVLMRLRTWN